MKKSVLIVLLCIMILLALCFLTGCANSGGIIGEYELVELRGDNATYTAKEWKDLTTIEHSLKINEDKTAYTVMTYIESTSNKSEKETDYYTYDDQFLYGTNNPGTEEGKKYFQYEYKDGTITLTVIGDTHNSVYVYKHK